MEKNTFDLLCFKNGNFTEQQRKFLKSKCFICSKNVEESAIGRERHRSTRKKTHFLLCKRCGNHLGEDDDADYHTLKVDRMYLSEAVAAGFPEAIADMGGNVAN